MPGAYAHMTLVNVLTKPDLLDMIPSLSKNNKLHIGQLFHFCELGAVSPDYPYLAIFNNNAKTWADRMHYVRTGEMIHSGLRLLKKLTGEEQNKAFVWLLGYSSHVVADVTIHPIVELRVGEYETNKTAHRTCEMNQDAYIYAQRLNKSGIAVSQHLKSGIGFCGDIHNPGNLDMVIATFWTDMLKEVYPDDFAANPPNVHEWHRGFRRIVDSLSAVSGILIPFARHVAANVGLIYPDASEVDPQFINGLKTPEEIMDYNLIFDAAVENTKSVWELIANGVFRNDTGYQSKIGDWNLDTGKDKNDQFGFWRQA